MIYNSENSLIILNVQLANILLENGCKLFYIGKNKDYSDRSIYYFEPTEKANKIKNIFINTKKEHKYGKQLYKN